MNLSNVEKEVLGFLFTKIGHDANASIGLRALHRHFSELSAAAFEKVCDDLIDKGLVGNYIHDLLMFTPDGWAQAHALEGAPPLPAGEQVAPVNEHLVWDLSQLADHRKASEFVMQFRRSLCVFSGPVQQLYSNYDILVPRDNERRLTILPNPAADHDTFNFIAPDAVVPTRLYIAPDASGALQLLMPVKAGGWQPMPLQTGLAMVQERLGEVPFLPVLTKGDLREQSPSNPVLHLHNVMLHKVTGRSGLEVRSIQRVIQGNIAEYFGFEPVRKTVVPVG